jgi:hypothetical protein
LTCLPRPEFTIDVEEVRLKTPWSVFNSVFRDYKPDNPTLIDECFEYDWSCTKLEKILKNEEEQLKSKEYLKSIYKNM